jgi:hypothetical protein
MDFASPGGCGRFVHGAFLHLGDSRWHRDDDPRPKPSAPVVDLADEMPEHRLGHFIIGDHPVAQRSHRHDVARGPPKHPFGVIPDRENLVGARLHRHHRGFAENNPVVPQIDQGVRRPEVDADVSGKGAKESADHGVKNKKQEAWAAVGPGPDGFDPAILRKTVNIT